MEKTERFLRRHRYIIVLMSVFGKNNILFDIISIKTLPELYAIPDHVFYISYIFSDNHAGLKFSFQLLIIIMIKIKAITHFTSYQKNQYGKVLSRGTSSDSQWLSIIECVILYFIDSLKLSSLLQLPAKFDHKT